MRSPGAVCPERRAQSGCSRRPSHGCWPAGSWRRRAEASDWTAAAWGRGWGLTTHTHSQRAFREQRGGQDLCTQHIQFISTSYREREGTRDNYRDRKRESQSGKK